MLPLQFAAFFTVYEYVRCLAWVQALQSSGRSVFLSAPFQRYVDCAETLAFALWGWWVARVDHEITAWLLCCPLVYIQPATYMTRIAFLLHAFFTHASIHIHSYILRLREFLRVWGHIALRTPTCRSRADGKLGCISGPNMRVLHHNTHVHLLHMIWLLVYCCYCWFWVKNSRRHALICTNNNLITSNNLHIFNHYSDLFGNDWPPLTNTSQPGPGRVPGPRRPRKGLTYEELVASQCQALQEALVSPSVELHSLIIWKFI